MSKGCPLGWPFSYLHHMAKSTAAIVAERVLKRAREVLHPVGQWPSARRLINVSQIAQTLAARLPGDARDYEIDHVRPLAGFNLRVPEQVAAAFAPSNHQWLRRSANRAKGAR